MNSGGAEKARLGKEVDRISVGGPTAMVILRFLNGLLFTIYASG